MSEFYTLPFKYPKTNGSYVVPTSHSNRKSTHSYSLSREGEFYPQVSVDSINSRWDSLVKSEFDTMSLTSQKTNGSYLSNYSDSSFFGSSHTTADDKIFNKTNKVGKKFTKLFGRWS